MSNDLISRSALKKAIMYGDVTDTWEELYDSVLHEIDNAPTVEPKKPQAKWTEDGDCSKCGKSRLSNGWGRGVKSAFCPWCGADMGEGAEND